MRGSLKVARVAGIDIDVHVTWLLAFGVITLGLALSLYPTFYPEWTRTQYWVTGAVSSVLLFFSVLAHEMAHSLVAVARGMRVVNITLFIFGGMSNIGREAETPGTEFAVSVVGPVTSLLIAAGLWAAYLSTPARGSPLAGVLNYMATVNAMLAVFNMLPGFPMDGGRVLRAFLWRRSGNYVRATKIAAGIGVAFGWMLIAFGVFLVYIEALISGIWMGLIGWFLIMAASGARKQAVTREVFRGVMVRELMDRTPFTLAPDESLEKVSQEASGRIGRGLHALPVVSQDQVRGIFRMGEMERVPRERWGDTLVGDVMTVSPLRAALASDTATEALERMDAAGLQELLVMEHGRLVGVVSREQLARFLKVRETAGVR